MLSSSDPILNTQAVDFLTQILFDSNRSACLIESQLASTLSQELKR